MRSRRKASALAMLAAVAAALGSVGGCASLDGLARDDGAAAPDAAGADGGTVDGDTTADALPDGSSADGSTMDGSSACPRGICPTVLMPAIGPQRLAVHGGFVYWTTATSIARVDFGGANLKTLALTGAILPPAVRDIAVGAAGVPYVTVPSGGAALCAADLTSCGTGFIGSAGRSSSVTVDATNVYVGIFDDGSGTNGAIFRAGLDGATPMAYTLADSVRDLQVVGGITYFRTGTAIRSTTAVTTAPVNVTSLGIDTPLAFVVLGSTLVVATTNGRLHSCDLSMGTPCVDVIVHLTNGAITAVTGDGSHIYWAEGGAAGSVYRCDLPGCGNPELLAEGQASPVAIEVDLTSVRWANHGDPAGVGGAIMRLPK